MKYFFLIFAVTATASAMEPLLFPSKNKVIESLSPKLLSFISQTLHTGKPRLDLRCSIKVREIKQERRFSDGIKAVEMLEIDYSSGYPDSNRKFFIATGSTLARSVKSSERAGSVEEFVMESDDDLQSRFVFQHNGIGEIIWMSFENDLLTDPCRLR